MINADIMSYLAGNSVKLDGTGKLIVAMAKAGILDRREAVLTQAEYMMAKNGRT